MATHIVLGSLSRYGTIYPCIFVQQALGQLIWCAAHTLWIGSSFMVTTSLALMAHHAFGCWHGDFRLRRKWGDVRSLLLYVDI